MDFAACARQFRQTGQTWHACLPADAGGRCVLLLLLAGTTPDRADVCSISAEIRTGNKRTPPPCLGRRVESDRAGRSDTACATRTPGWRLRSAHSRMASMARPRGAASQCHPLEENADEVAAASRLPLGHAYGSSAGMSLGGGCSGVSFPVGQNGRICSHRYCGLSCRTSLNQERLKLFSKVNWVLHEVRFVIGIAISHQRNRRQPDSTFTGQRNSLCCSLHKNCCT